MSYYEKSKFNVMDHCVLRVKQRLNLKEDEFELRIKISKMISNSYLEFKDKNGFHYYLYDSKNYIYFIVDSTTNSAITFTKISYEKKISLIS